LLEFRPSINKFLVILNQNLNFILFIFLYNFNIKKGSPQSILINFEENEVCPKTLLCMFQGGFSGKDCEIKGFINDTWETITDFYPEDNNNLQISFIIYNYK